MRLKSSRQTLFRNHETALFHSNKYSLKQRQYYFYLLLLPTLEFLKQELIDSGLTSYEVDSELFILAANLFNNYNKEKSSIVPYLEKWIPWKVREMFERIEKEKLKEEPIGLPILLEEDFIKEEFYYNNILFEDRWIGKSFTRQQKCFIYRIITSDNNDLTINCLSRRSKTGRKITKQILLDIKEVMQSEER